MKDTGKIIAKLRVKKGLTTSSLARKLKVKESVVKKWENGTKLPTLFQLKKLAHLFDVKISKLVSDDILIQSIERNYHKMWLRIAIVIFLLFMIAIGGYYAYRYIKANNIQDVYLFTGESEHFSFDEGIVTLTGQKRFISLSHFNCQDDLTISDLTINVAFNNKIWVAEEYHYNDEESVTDWLNKLVIKEEGKKDASSKDSFLTHSNDNFIDNMQIEINYCDMDDKCVMEIMDLKLHTKH